ncbi:hypothetical protein ACJJTC_006404 [Scirpophaga incertulas]
MDSCIGVEQDLDKAISKFTALSEHTDKVLFDVIEQVENLKNEIAKQPPDTPLSQTQAMVANELADRVKKTVFQMSTEHRELHATVSRVGKAIDRHFILDYASVAPKAESFCSNTNKSIMEEAIAQHLYRQGLEEVGDTLVAEAGLEGVERTCTFAQLQRCAGALAAGDPGPALLWAERRAHDLAHSPLPFTLHRMQALKLARECGVAAAIEYVRAQFPAHAARHERQLQAAVCALAWCTEGAPPPPPHYRHLLEPAALGEWQLGPPLAQYTAAAAGRRVRAGLVHGGRAAAAAALPPPAGARRARTQRQLQAAVCALAWCTEGAPPPPPHYRHLLEPAALGAEAAELFTREACALLRLAPLSPLAGAVLAGARVLPALHDIRAKMTHPHVIAAWADDELPLEVDLGEDGGGYHSVFACPILRQQASDQNPPMRLLCGHVISRDALNKLATGAKSVKLKCPYCPTEQAPSEARQIYFA